MLGTSRNADEWVDSLRLQITTLHSTHSELYSKDFMDVCGEYMFTKNTAQNVLKCMYVKTTM